ncbi:MAG: NHLP bacteriocin system secretion protein [Myxococcota bacterium]|nr:NHLP bacteriocin system secretion protein [Myxococcota bacterium]
MAETVFRDAALTKLRSPEQTDEPPALPRLALPVAGLGLLGLAVLALAWGIGGRLAETAAGDAVLVAKDATRPVQARAGGQLVRWLVGPGDRVQPEQVLGVLAQPVLEQELAQARHKLGELTGRNVELGGLRVRYLDLEREGQQAQQQRLQRRIAELQQHVGASRGYLHAIRQLQGRHLQGQQSWLDGANRAAAETSAALQRRLESYERLQGDQLTSAEQVAAARRSLEDSRLAEQEIALRGAELELNRLRMMDAFEEATQRLRSREEEVARLQLVLLDLQTAQTRATREALSSEHGERREAEDLAQAIGRLELQLREGRELRTPQAGRVLELSVAPGTVVRPGEQVALLDTSREGDPLIALAYFPVAAGKRIQPGQEVRLAPSTVDARQHGQVLGLVRRVSAYPVSPEAVASEIGSGALARELVGGGPRIEVEVELRRSAATFSGYAWTSTQGARQRLSAGTKALLSLTLEQRRPLSLLLPGVRAWLGGSP